MERYLIYSDPHWSQYSSIIKKRGLKYSVRLENLIKSFNWLESFAISQKCTGIISCGDFFDKSRLNAEEITALQDVNFSDIEHYFLVGNHESNINTLEYSTTMIFDNKNYHVYNSISRFVVNDKVDFYFIPYLMSDSIPKLGDIIEDKRKKNVVFAHQELAGIQYGKFVSQSGFSVEDIKNNCTLFLDGHLHNNMNVSDNIILVGNLTGQNFNEDATKFSHLIYVLTVEDDGKITLDSYENPYAFNFYHLKVDSKSDLSQFDKLKTNAVVSIMCNSNLSDEVDKLLISNKNIIEYKKTISYTNLFNDNFESDSDFKVYNHFEQFIQFAQQKFENTPALMDELSRLGGNM